MKIAINALSAHTGAGVSVLRQLLPHLAAVDTHNAYTIFHSPAQCGIADAIPQTFHAVVIHHLPRNPFIRALWEQIVFPWLLLRHRIDVLYSTGNTTSLLAPCAVVLLMENANPYSALHLPWSWKERVRLMLLRVLGWFSAQRATTIRFVSKNSQDRIVSQLGVSTDKCMVIHHGVANISSAMTLTAPNPSSGGRGNPYILTIGANGPHRNTERLIEAFSILIHQYGYQGDLLIVGNTGSAQHRQALDGVVKKLGLLQRVWFEGEVPHHEIGNYFKHADAFVFPSLEETFGIPLIEAMAMGVPIAVSDGDLDTRYCGKCFTPFREICGDAAQYFNPFDVEDIEKGMHRICTDEPYRRACIVNGRQRATQYDVAMTARALVQLFESVYNR